MTTAGSILKAARVAKKMTQERLTELTGISVSHIAKIENDKRGMSVAYAILLADALGMNGKARTQLLDYAKDPPAVRQIAQLVDKVTRLEARMDQMALLLQEVSGRALGPEPDDDEQRLPDESRTER